MESNTYEIMLVTSAQMTDEESTTLVQSFYKFIEDTKGKVLHADLWGRRKIAYEIEDQQYGIFHLLYIEANGETVTELYKQTGYNEQVLKMFLVAVEDADKAFQEYKELKANPNKNVELFEKAGE